MGVYVYFVRGPHREKANCMGFDIQLCLARYPGIALSDSPDIPKVFLEYVGVQLGTSIIKFENYGKGKKTLLNNFTAIFTHYNYQECTLSNLSYLKKILEDTVKENFDKLYLLKSADQEFRSKEFCCPMLLKLSVLLFRLEQLMN